MSTLFTLCFITITLLEGKSCASFLYINDICEADSLSLETRSQQGFLQTPTDFRNNYPSNRNCHATICLRNIHILVELTQFNFQPAEGRQCLDYIQIGDYLKLCNANVQGTIIPITVQDCLGITFISNADSYTGSGTKIRFQALPDLSSVHVLCERSTLKRVHESQITPYGYFKTAEYPLPLLGRVECSDEHVLPTTCVILRVDFLDFYTQKENKVIINGLTFTGDMTGAMKLFTVSSQRSISIALSFVNQYPATKQALLLKYSCESRGLLKGFTEILPQTSVGQSPLYIAGSMSAEDVGSITTKQMFSLKVPAHSQTFFYLASWWSKPLASFNDFPVRLLIEKQPLQKANSHMTLRSNLRQLTIDINVNPINSVYNYGFALLYQDKVDGVYDVCQQKTILPQRVGFILSPNYPENYEANLDCSTTLLHTEGRSIELEILDFITEEVTESGYDHDYLVVRTSEIELKYQGSSIISRPALTVQSDLSIRLVTDSFNEMRGFLLRYTVLESTPSTVSSTMVNSQTTMSSPSPTTRSSLTTTTSLTMTSIIIPPTKRAHNESHSSSIDSSKAVQSLTSETPTSHKKGLTDVTMIIAIVVGVITLITLIIIIVYAKMYRERRMHLMLRKRSQQDTENIYVTAFSRERPYVDNYSISGAGPARSKAKEINQQRLPGVIKLADSAESASRSSRTERWIDSLTDNMKLHPIPAPTVPGVISGSTIENYRTGDTTRPSSIVQDIERDNGERDDGISDMFGSPSLDLSPSARSSTRQTCQLQVTQSRMEISFVGADNWPSPPPIARSINYSSSTLMVPTPRVNTQQIDLNSIISPPPSPPPLPDILNSPAPWRGLRKQEALEECQTSL